jgi:phosphopantetheinyl transferase (holo-ACP synthase)
VGWRDSEIVLNGDGSPTLQFHGRAKVAAARLNATDALVSLTHSARSAAAVVILVGGGDAGERSAAH